MILYFRSHIFILYFFSQFKENKMDSWKYTKKKKQMNPQRHLGSNCQPVTGISSSIRPLNPIIEHFKYHLSYKVLFRADISRLFFFFFYNFSSIFFLIFWTINDQKNAVQNISLQDQNQDTSQVTDP